MITPRLSLLIAVDPHNPILVRDLEGWAEQTCSPADFELVIVAWEGSPDFTSKIAAFRARHPQGPAVTYHRIPQTGRAAMHNTAMGLARAPMFCFMASDFSPVPNVLQTHLAFHEAHPALEEVGFGGTHSPERLREASPFLAWLEDTGTIFGVRFREEAPAHPPDYFYVGNTSIKREFIEKGGPFDERIPYPSLDDAMMGVKLAKLGLRSTFLLAAKTWHEHPITLKERCGQMVQSGKIRAWVSPLAVCSFRHRRPAPAERESWRARYWRFRLTLAFALGYGRGLLSRNPA